MVWLLSLHFLLLYIVVVVLLVVEVVAVELVGSAAMRIKQYIKISKHSVPLAVKRV
jgi:hypothetical protein